MLGEFAEEIKKKTAVILGERGLGQKRGERGMNYIMIDG